MSNHAKHGTRSWIEIKLKNVLIRKAPEPQKVLENL